MIINPIFKESIYKIFHFFDIKAFIEILFFSILFYYISIWLKKDKQKNLLFYFYFFCFLAFITYIFQLKAISYFLFIFSPAIIMLFILLHQKTLQQNFVSYRNILKNKLSIDDWLESLIRSCLYSINKSKDLIFVIEKNDPLNEFLEIPFKLNTPLQDDLLETLIENKNFDSKKLIWLDKNGNIISINASWKNLPFESKDENNLAIITSNMDSLILKTTAITRNFEITIKGKTIENLDTNNAIQIIKRFLLKKDSDL